MSQVFLVRPLILHKTNVAPKICSTKGMDNLKLHMPCLATWLQSPLLKTLVYHILASYNTIFLHILNVVYLQMNTMNTLANFTTPKKRDREWLCLAVANSYCRPWISTAKWVCLEIKCKINLTASYKVNKQLLPPKTRKVDNKTSLLKHITT